MHDLINFNRAFVISLITSLSAQLWASTASSRMITYIHILYACLAVWMTLLHIYSARSTYIIYIQNSSYSICCCKKTVKDTTSTVIHTVHTLYVYTRLAWGHACTYIRVHELLRLSGLVGVWRREGVWVCEWWCGERECCSLCVSSCCSRAALWLAMWTWSRKDAIVLSYSWKEEGHSVIATHQRVCGQIKVHTSRASTSNN